MRLQAKLGLKAWAVVIDKVQWDRQEIEGEGEAIRERAWRHMIQRIETFTRYGKDTCIIFPDEGHPKFVRGMIRKMRRFSLVPSAYETGTLLEREATLIVEDPNFRQSEASYYLQLADLNAYAAYRRIFPTPTFGSDYWEQLGDARVNVSKIRRRANPLIPFGISPWPETVPEGQ